jgi:hypothetical protein
MTERYTNWISLLAGRDAALWSIFLLACLFVAGWRITGTIIDSGERQRLQAAYIVGGFIVFYASLALVAFAR